MGELFCIITVFSFNLSKFWNAKGKPLDGWYGSSLKLVAWTAVWALPKSVVEVLSSVYHLYACETEAQESSYGLLEKKY